MKSIIPHITEKSVKLAKKHQFTLKVEGSMSKYEIKQMTKKLFKVEPKKVLIINGKNRKITTMRKQGKMKRGINKAIVVLGKGEILSGFETYLEDDKKKQKAPEEDKKS